MTGEQLVNKFNSLFPVGAKCHWRSVGRYGVPYETVTVRAPAFISASGHPVVFFEEHRGYCSIDEMFTLYDILPATDIGADEPIDMILPCPVCKTLHVDKPEPNWCKCGHSLSHHSSQMMCNAKGDHPRTTEDYRGALQCKCLSFTVAWNNPPHKSHLCHSCGTVWRPADVATNGVAEIKTEGKNDTWHPTGADYPTA